MRVTEYTLGNTLLRYFVTDDNLISMYIVPLAQKDAVKNGWEYPDDPWTTTAPYMRQWRVGRLAHFHLSHHSIPITGGDSLKFASESLCYFEKQEVDKDGDVTIIKTYLTSKEGHKVVHYIKYKEGYQAFWTWNEFTNMLDEDVVMDHISSFAFENLSPFCEKDSRERMVLHRFTGGWSMEARHQEDTFEHLAIEKGWQGYCNEKSLRFGSIGSYTNRNYFPLVVVEDRKQNVFWTAQLYCNSSWQCDVSKDIDSVSFSGGLADGDFGQWYKVIKAGESFTTPLAAISATDDDLAFACQSVVKLQEEARKAYGEEGFPISFNEFCSTWGKPTQENFTAYAKKAGELGAKYVVIDAGWSGGTGYGGQTGNGGWLIDTKKFPDMKAMNQELRAAGLIPGLWFEFECTTSGAKEFGPEYDHLHLKKRGTVIKVGGGRSYWDMTNPEVIDFLTERVIKLLKDNEFGYIKVDYNANLGIGCDGSDSLGEGLRRQGEGTRDFFKKIKEEIPDIIIENCASGGNRNNPVMLGVSGIASFSDAHECIEIPIIAADLHNHMLPMQSSVWAVLHDVDSDERLQYSLCAGLFGRLCLSGDIDKLSPHQEEIVHRFVAFYNRMEAILKDGVTRTYRKMKGTYRYPKGTQVSVRNTDNELLVVCHSFEEPYSDEMTIAIPEGFTIVDAFANDAISMEGTSVKVKPMKELSACAVYAVKK